MMRRWFGRFQVTATPHGAWCRDFLLPSGKAVPHGEYAYLDQQGREQVWFQQGLIPGGVGASHPVAQQRTEDRLFWQFPCRTESAAWDRHAGLAHAGRSEGAVHLYLGLPWATWIDCDRRQSWGVGGLLARQTELHIAKVRISGWRHALDEIGLKLRVHTVCQHIEWRDLRDTWRQTGITDVWLAHLPRDAHQRQDLSPARLGFDVHPWALYAVNVEDPHRSSGMDPGRASQERQVLASFTGAHGPHYLSPSRQLLQQLAKEPDCLVRVTDKWHFDDVVYRHQIAGDRLESNYAIDASVSEYNRLLSDSVFSLCPAGTGPNTLRLWESLAAGCIPVMLGPEPMMPRGGSIDAIDWDAIVLRCTDADIALLPQRLRAIPVAERVARQQRALSAYRLVRQQACF